MEYLVWFLVILFNISGALEGNHASIFVTSFVFGIMTACLAIDIQKWWSKK